MKHRLREARGRSPQRLAYDVTGLQKKRCNRGQDSVSWQAIRLIVVAGELLSDWGRK